MKKLSILLIINFVILLSCLTKTNKPIRIDVGLKKEKLYYTDFCDSIKYIQLESNEKSIIGNIEQLLKDDSLLFILDMQQKTIFIFDNCGNYINKVKRIGKGAEEYISITSFTIDSDNDFIYVLDDVQQKILRYDYHSNFLGKLSYNREEIIRSIGLLANGNFIFFTPDYMARGRDGVWEVDTLGNFIKEFRDVNPNNKFVFIPYPYYCILNKTISFYDSFSNEIYSIFEDKIVLKYRFDLVQKMPEKFLKNEQGTERGGTGSYYMNRFISETENQYYLQFYSTEKGLIHVIFNKKSKKIIISDALYNDFENVDGSEKLFTYDNYSMIGVIWKNDITVNPILQIVYFN